MWIRKWKSIFSYMTEYTVIGEKIGWALPDASQAYTCFWGCGKHWWSLNWPQSTTVMRRASAHSQPTDSQTRFFSAAHCAEKKKIKNVFQNKNEHKSSFYLLVFGTISVTFRQVATSQFSCHNRQEWQDRFNMLSYSSVKIFLFNFILSLSLLSGAPNRGQ